MSKQPKTSVTVALVGMTKQNFDAVAEHIVENMPGLSPTNAEVGRYALHLAAEKVADMHKEAMAVAEVSGNE